MRILQRQVVEIPIHRVNGIDALFGRMMKMDPGNIPAKFTKVFNETRDIAYQRYTMQCIFESFTIAEMNIEAIQLEEGLRLESALFTDVFRGSSALGFIVVALFGYDEIDESEDNMLRKLFLDNWGTAFIECGDKWVMQSIAMDLEKDGLYITHAFSPGQNNIPIEMQAQVFQAIEPEAIGVTLNAQFMMHPKKTVSGIFGIGTEKSETRVRPCDLCEKRETCPTAYV
ncbi:hypothetical protein MASR2M70_21560 [Bacillota bacterium]